MSGISFQQDAVYYYQMLLIVHVGIALTSIVFTAWAYFRPSDPKLHMCYALVASTLITGTVLVVQHPDKFSIACISGLIYLQLTAAGIIFVHRKLKNGAVATQ